MKCFLRVTGYEVRHGFLSMRLWGTVAAFTAMLLLDSWTDIYNAHTQDYYTSDIIYLALNSMMGFSYMFWLRFCLFGIPYGGPSFSGCCMMAEHMGQSERLF